MINAAHSWDTSIVFGLTGAWGSGISSIISLINEQLDCKDFKWVIARFTPWATSDVASLTQEFFACLSEALPSKRETGKKIRTALGTCATIASPLLNLIPFVGGAPTCQAGAVPRCVQFLFVPIPCQLSGGGSLPEIEGSE
ncbi:P-loop NTPase fold protein [Paeniglutamicibacter sp. NPDC091659]|uniref:P-loop NTPase fold protein n=1 Tax=Paeniglutamicibacter sp. NPDC091659 TaxID=3364389 RepID=UPI00382FAA59